MEFRKEEFKFPATKNKNGECKYENDIKQLIYFKENLFDDNVIFMSDMHTYTAEMIDILVSKIDLSKYMVITLGDMWDDGIMGSDGDPTLYYLQLHKLAKELYIIQGNHDLLPKKDL